MKKGTKQVWLLGCFLAFLVWPNFYSLSYADSANTNSDEENILQGNVGAEDRAYRIRPGDVILIDVWRVPVLGQKVKVGLDGTFLYPLLGSVTAEGKTVDELRTYLTEALSENYLVDPVVTVTIDSGTQGFFVVGEVKRPGSFKLEEKIDVYQAIITAGGFTDFASKRGEIIRQKGDNQKGI